MKTVLFLYIFFFVIFFAKALSYIDPDFGWHLRTGEYIKMYGIPKTDLFSYSMPSYQVIDHEWLTDTGIATIDPFLGRAGLAVIAAILGTLSLMLQISWKEKDLAIPLILSSAAFLPIIGVRPLVVSWLFFSLLLVILRQKKNWQKLRPGLPLLFLVWANMHGSFPVGIITLAIYIFFSCLEERKMLWIDIGILLSSIAVTFLNPYGARLWQEVGVTLSQPEVHFIFVEWYPIFFYPYFPFWILIILSAFLIFRYRRKYFLTEKTLFVLLLVLAAQGVRNIPYWVIFSLPLTVRGIAFLKAEAGEEGRKRFGKALRFFGIFAAGVIVLQNLRIVNPVYPENAVTYLREHMPTGNIFADFDWGGYLVWQLPEKKVFIDGRMSNWRQSAGKQETDNALRDFYWVANRAESIEDLTSKYNIDTLLFTPVPFEKWKQGDIDLFGVNGKKKYPEIMTQLSEGGWKEVYKDPAAIIYQK